MPEDLIDVVGSNNISFVATLTAGSDRTIAFPDANGTVGLVTAIAAGTQTLSNNSLVFSNSNGVTFGMSTAAGGATITATVVPGAAAGIGAIEAGTQTATSGTVDFSNSNNISFGMSNSSLVTASYAFNVSAGTTSNNLNAVTYSNSNNVSFGLNGSTITGSAQVNVSAGTTSNNLSALTFSNSNNVSFGLNGSTMTASAALTMDFFDNCGENPGAIAGGENLAGQTAFRQISIVPYGGAIQNSGFPADITANTCMFQISQSGSTATMSQAFSSSVFFAVYTASGGTLSLLNSCSMSWGFGAAATNNSTGIVGVRFGTIHSSQWSSQPVFKAGSRYYLGYIASSSGVACQTCEFMGASIGQATNASGSLMVASTNTNQSLSGWILWAGIRTAISAGFPASFATGDIQRNVGNLPTLVPRFILANNTASTAF